MEIEKKAVREKQTKRAIIKEYEKLYKVSLTVEELDQLLEKSFSNRDISPDTKKKVKEKLEKKTKKEEE